MIFCTARPERAHLVVRDECPADERVHNAGEFVGQADRKADGGGGRDARALAKQQVPPVGEENNGRREAREDQRGTDQCALELRPHAHPVARPDGHRDRALYTITSEYCLIK